MKKIVLAAIVFAMGLSGASVAVSGPVSEYYLTAGDEGNIHVVQGSNVNLTWAQTEIQEYAIAVPGTVRTLGITGALGAEYTLGGTPTGTTYSYSIGGGVYDGASDGTYNYAWNFTHGVAYRFDLNWANPIQLFTLGNTSGNRIGITYDPTNNSLWLSGFNGTVGNLVENRAMDGTFLSSFIVSHNNNAALALDPADGTLWLHDRNSLNSSALVFEQYSKTGVLLSSQSYPGLAGQHVMGGEFLVPEPATICLLSLGGLLLRKKKSA